MVFARVGDDWKVVHEHFSPLGGPRFHQDPDQDAAPRFGSCQIVDANGVARHVVMEGNCGGRPCG
jgi:hypothetical protein